MSTILDAREQRSIHIKQLIESNIGSTIAVLKINVIGEEKNPKYMMFIRRLFHSYIMNEFQMNIIEWKEIQSLDGDYIFYVIDELGRLVKEKMVHLEEQTTLGRLVDIDVYDTHSISRTELQYPMRRCLICEDDAHVCARSKKHTLKELQSKTLEIIKDGLFELVLDTVMSMIHYELEMYPRFGLVSKTDNGCHDDMDYSLFLKSTDAIEPYIEEYIKVGFSDIVPKKLQEIGLEAEHAMFEDTNGINTQKGLIFALGVFLPALINSIIENEDTNYLQSLIQDITKEIVGDYYDHLNSKKDLSHGDHIYLQYGIKGIRGEALNGFPLLFDQVEHKKGSKEDSFEYLLHIMSRLDDTTIIHRKGMDALKDVQKEIKELIDKGGYKNNKNAYIELSNRFKKQGISPGGSSDLLVVTLIFENLKYLLRVI